MKIEIRVNESEMSKIKSIFAPINAFVKEDVNDSEGIGETFSTIIRNMTAGYEADHKAYSCILRKEDEEYLISLNFKDIFMNIISEFGNKVARLFIGVAKSILGFCKDSIIERLKELNDDYSNDKRVAIVGTEVVPYSNAWRSSKKIEHDKAIMFDIQGYVNSHDTNDSIKYLTTAMNDELETLIYNKAFFINLFADLEAKSDDEVLKNRCKQAINNLKA